MKEVSKYVSDLIAQAKEGVAHHAPTESEVLAYRLADALDVAIGGLQDRSARLDEVATVAGEVAKAHEGHVGTHYENCWKYHAGCLARVILEIIEGE